MLIKHMMRHSKTSPTATENEVKTPLLDFISIVSVLFLIVMFFFLCIGNRKKAHVNKEGTGQRLDRNSAS